MDPHLLPKHYEDGRSLRGYDLHRNAIETGLHTYLGSEADRTDLIDSLTPEAFTDLTVRIHEVVTGRPDEDMIMVNMTNTIIDDVEPSYSKILAAPEDKQALLDYALQVAQASTDPRLKPLVLAYAINIVHPFSDGNGRTARGLYRLLSRDFAMDDPSAIAEVTAPDADQRVLLNDSLFTNSMNVAFGETIGSHTFNDATGQLVPKFAIAIESAHFNPASIIERRLAASPEPHKTEAAWAALLTDQFAGEVLMAILAGDATSQAAQNAVQTHNGQNIFILDRFTHQATDLDTLKMYNLYRDLKYEQATYLIKILGETDSQAYMQIPTTEHGLITSTTPLIAVALAEGTITYDESFALK